MGWHKKNAGMDPCELLADEDEIDDIEREQKNLCAKQNKMPGKIYLSPVKNR